MNWVLKFLSDQPSSDTLQSYHKFPVMHLRVVEYHIIRLIINHERRQRKAKVLVLFQEFSIILGMNDEKKIKKM